MLTDQQTQTMALATLGVLGGALVVWLLSRAMRTGYTWAQLPFYPLLQLYGRVIWRTTISGPLPVADHQGAVIVANHRSAIDPAFVQLAANRLGHWMVAREFCTIWGLGWVFRILWAIPVNRGGVDTAATKAAIRFAEEGDLVGLFPEGRINTTDDVLLPGRPGAALIALKARVPVIPCFIHGAPYDGTTFGCFFMPARVHVAVGQPIDISAYYGREGEKEVLEELTLRFLKEMAKLAGQPDFQPRLAGRFYKPGLTEENHLTVGAGVQ
ncbi:MAG: 1-acyl-sn-glycerol-3-phosphate acyltransferase [Planctomycetaceae bacterium]|nr:1-acyl-sn-glycerol-3-phosphate acyltransferase [Planctomycetaceae bacterium]